MELKKSQPIQKLICPDLKKRMGETIKISTVVKLNAFGLDKMGGYWVDKTSRTARIMFRGDKCGKVPIFFLFLMVKIQFLFFV